jgi:hypothetical protein
MHIRRFTMPLALALALAASGAVTAPAFAAPSHPVAQAARPDASVKVVLKVGCGRFAGWYSTKGAGTKKDAEKLLVTGTLSNTCGLSFLQIRGDQGKKSFGPTTIKFDDFDQSFPVNWPKTSTSGAFSHVELRLGNVGKNGKLVWGPWDKV